MADDQWSETTIFKVKVFLYVNECKFTCRSETKIGRICKFKHSFISSP